MFEWLTTCCRKASLRPFASSTAHRNAQRGILTTEVLESTLAAFSPTVVIPAKVMQSSVSFYSLFRGDTQPSEKMTHFLQAAVAIAQLGIGIALLYEGNECQDTSNTLCRTAFLLQLVYRGLTLSTSIPSEFSKAPYDPAAAVVVGANPAAQAPAV